jgi:predicted DNA-binding protein
MGKRNDRHRSRFMVRLPEIYRIQLNKLRRRTGLTIVEVVRAALEDHLDKHGLWPPKGEGEK